MRVALQPASNKDARKHYQATIERPVPMHVLEGFLAKDEALRLRELHGGAAVPTWGVTPGISNKGKWERLSSGDCVLFAANKRVYASAVVTIKAHVPDLARNLWGSKKDGQTWEYIYFLTDLVGHDIPVAEIQKLLEYKDGFRVQGFNVLDEEKSERLRAAFELDASLLLDGDEEESGEGEPELHDASVEGELDSPAQAMRRKEQKKLKRLLLGSRKVGECAICGRKVPAPLLVAAHIKKRSCCSDGERRDLRNVAVLMCKLGCDDLYEKGYLSVNEGIVVLSPLLVRTPALDSLVALLEGRKVPAFRPATSEYFGWHVKRVFKAAP